MTWKKLGKVLLFPHRAVLALLLPVGGGLLVYAMCTLEETDPRRIAAYVLASYTLTVWCVRLPGLLRAVRTLRRENRYLRRWADDPALRTNVTLLAGLAWNGAYGALQLGLGLYHHSAWYDSLAAYYGSLAVMRFSLARHTLRHRPGQQLRQELVRYRACGWVLLVMNLALSCMMAHMIRQNRAVRHHEITTIATAAYTFTALVWAIVSAVRCRRYNSPAMSAARAISLAAACVSLLTLENTMPTTFGEGLLPRTRQLFLTLSGGAVSTLIVVLAAYMIVQANRNIRYLEIQRLES